jgi:hypothetical protein
MLETDLSQICKKIGTIGKGATINNYDLVKTAGYRGL